MVRILRTMKYPDWVLKHKTKNTEIRLIGKNYYLYKTSHEWDKEKKQSKKITGDYLGKITEEGIVNLKNKQLANIENITIKEFGASKFISTQAQDIIQSLKDIFPDIWKEIFVFAAYRFFFSSPLKNVRDHYCNSHLSDIFPDAKVSPKTLSGLLDSIGKQRNLVKEFFSKYITEGETLAVDITHIFSRSEDIISSTLGRNSEHQYIPQIDLLLLFSLDKMRPIYYRMLAGSIRDVSSLIISMAESGVKNIVLVSDKGFYSLDNINEISGNVNYILPLKRNSHFIDYSQMKHPGKNGFDGHFLFEKRVIWYYEHIFDEKRIVTFLDERLKVEEEKDLLIRVDEKKHELTEFYENQFKFGTISIITKTEFPPQKIFEFLKSRVNIEVVFDTFKNVLNADRSYMRSDSELEGWEFINFIALLLYYEVYMLLVSKDILSKYSPKDVILHLARVQKIKIGTNWRLAETPKKSRILIEKLGLNMDGT
jgi:transposase